MDFRTIVDIPESPWKIEPCERMLFIGSCFADNIGKRFADERFRTVVNPYGVMYNPASILHTVQRLLRDGAMPFSPDEQGTAVMTLGTNHVYILKETGEIVDNCQKRPQRLFEERKLTVSECAAYLDEAISLISRNFPKTRFILTVSPIRYRKYGYHESQLSKATLLLAIDSLVKTRTATPNVRQTNYFPSFEIINDELRDYRFYKPDMLHPSDQAIDYIFERIVSTYFSDATVAFLKEWKPIREALNHRPLHPESEEYRRFKQQTEDRLKALEEKYGL
jgi:hypothetical protein